jgi:hypothetical protein
MKCCFNCKFIREFQPGLIILKEYRLYCYGLLNRHLIFLICCLINALYYSFRSEQIAWNLVIISTPLLLYFESNLIRFFKVSSLRFSIIILSDLKIKAFKNLSKQEFEEYKIKKIHSKKDSMDHYIPQNLVFLFFRLNYF